eukprot:g9302.t1
MRLTRAAAVAAVLATRAAAASAAAAASLDPDTEACLDACSSKGRPEAALLVCYDICLAVRERNETACGQDLLDASFEHLTLLSFSSGHVFETIAILQGALFGGERHGHGHGHGDGDATAELAAFFAESHLNDRGSPAACSDVKGAHYCLGQGPPMFASLGLCLPRSCGTNFINGVLGNVTDDGSGLGGAALSFSCGDELRVEADTGTLAVLYLVGTLVALVCFGTAVDYCNRLREKTHGSLPDGRSGGGSGGGGGGFEEVKGGTSFAQQQQGLVMPSRSLLDFVIPDDAAYSDDDTGIRQRLLPPTPEKSVESGGSAAAAVEAGEQKLKAEEDGGGGGGGGASSHRQQPGHDREVGGHQGPVQRGSQRGRRRWFGERLECFSVLVNVDSLLAPPRAGDEFRALDGVRTLSMLWVILGNTLLYNLTGIGAGYSNFVDVMPHNGKGLFSRLSGQVIPGSFLAADTFFLVSGFLLTSMLLPKLDAGLMGGGSGGAGRRWAWIGKTYLHRYLRLTPTLAFVTLMFWKVLPLLGDGPVFWPLARSLEERCSRYWWTEITYLSSIAPWPPLSNGCILVTWWLSDEFMFFIAGVPLVALCHRHPRAGAALTVLAAAASCVFTLLWYGYHQDAHLSYFDLAKTPFAAPWARCPPYLLGILCGMVWHARFRGRVGSDGAGDATGGDSTRGGVGGGGLEVEGEANSGVGGAGVRRRRKREAMVTALVVLAGLTSAALMAFLVYGTYWAYQDMSESRLSPWQDHLYLAFSRPAWALGVALMCLLCFCGHGGVVDWLLTHPGWTTPSRLTYCAYLFHTGLLTVLYGSRDVATELTSLEYAVTYMGVVLGTFAGATLLHLLVEAPFRNLESLERRRRLVLLRLRERQI